MSKATEREKREKTQARVGLASNVVGLTAGVAATAAAARNKALRQPVQGNAGPATSRLTRYVKTPGGRARLIRAGAIGALGLQVTNTAGDVVANRVLSRESKIGKADIMPLIEQSYVSKGLTTPVTGVGVNIEKRAKDSLGRSGSQGVMDDAMYRQASDKAIRQAVTRTTVESGIGGGILGGVIGGSKAGRKGAVVGSLVGAHAGPALGGVQYGLLRRKRNDPKVRRNAEARLLARQVGRLRAQGKAVQINTQKWPELVGKRYFDAEADRQRRIGAASGILGGTAIVSGAAAARGIKGGKGVLQLADGGHRAGFQAGFDVPKGGSVKRAVRTKAGLAALAAASAGGSVASYKRGISRRNQTWQ